MVRAQNGNSRRLRAYSVFATSAGALLGPSYAPGLLALQCFPTVECRFKALHLSGGGDRGRRPGWAGLGRLSDDQVVLCVTHHTFRTKTVPEPNRPTYFPKNSFWYEFH